ncbi:hypothetical protein K461DRAFT_291149 [Myriangium duriaei CBS 260.36]|uniref:HOOK N-terminal domain-containing protein n=1 Tax=Myriangium duriaei CBS 260.36 TaxID=1168546 RepID=A0A9P4MKF2_9PEZI|nr:hypothetical protein K461DRAFT_291149 [Myriangium duriaei CBS 260.36]
MAADPPNLSKALLQWVQTFSTQPATKHLSELRDGHIIQQILHDIDPAYFPVEGLPAGTTETANNWVQRWQNLKHIQRGVDGYIRDVCGVVGSDAGRHANLKAVAQAESGAADADIVQLLKGILRAAMYSPESNQRMGRVVVGLGAEAAGTIAAAMAGMEEERYQEEGENGALDRAEDESEGQNGLGSEERGTPDEHLKSPSRKERQDRDLELEHEEKLISAHRIIRQLEESNAKAALELEDLRVEKKRIEDAFEALQQDSQHGASRRAEDDRLRELRDRSDKDKDYIAELESELETARSTTDSQGRQLERLKGSADSVQRLKDDLQLLRAERDELASKTRTNENLRKKIQNLQDAERQGAQLREDLRVAQEQLSTLDTLRDRCDALQKANAENMNIIASSEQEIFDMRSGRKRLEHELRVLGQKYDIARERQSRDHETITELEARLAQLDTSDGEGQTPGGLGEEMDRADRPRPPSRKASIVATGAADGMLEERLAALGKRNKALEEQYLDLLSDKLGLETALGELKDGGKMEVENVPFLEQRAKLQSVTTERDEAKAESQRLTAELAERKEKSLTGGEDAKAEYKGLVTAYAGLTADAEELRAELEEQRALLRYALLSARGIGVEEDGEERRKNERKLVDGLLQEARKVEVEGVGEVADAVVARVEAARNDGAQQTATAEKDAAIATMQAELDSMREEVARLQAEAASKAECAAAPEQAVADEEQARAMAQLKRENTLMSTAWFDLSARIQRENVILGRRRESPKSWLGKQRGLVGLGVSGVGR